MQQVNQTLSWNELFSQYPELRTSMAIFLHEIRNHLNQLQCGSDLLKYFSDDLTAADKARVLDNIYEGVQEIQNLLPRDEI